MHNLSIIAILAPDPVQRAGITAMLDVLEGLSTRPFQPTEHKDFSVVVTNNASKEELAGLQLSHSMSAAPALIIADERLDIDVRAAAEAGVVAALHTREATQELILTAIKDALDGSRTTVGERLEALTGQVQRIHSLGAEPKLQLEISEREILVLRYLADGYDTTQLAKIMFLSERSVKYTLWRLMQRFSLRNRTHAVAFAIRSGIM
jgi:DNA-binding NarL/FixJ family response regulator